MGGAGQQAELEFASARSVSLAALTRAFNRSFEGYPISIQQTSDTLLRMLRENDVREEESLMAISPDGEVVGVALLGRRQTRAWVAGMGLAPDWRGKGHGAKLLTRLLARARELGVRMVTLEVLEENTVARRLYESMGFHETRRLAVYTGKAAMFEPQANSARQIVVRDIPSAEALAHYDALHSDLAPWQREYATLCHMAPRLKAVGCTALARTAPNELNAEAGRPTPGTQSYACLLYSPQSHGYSLLDVGSRGDSANRRHAGSMALINHLLRKEPEATLRAINVPPGDPLGMALDALGCPIVGRQREMALDLP